MNICLFEPEEINRPLSLKDERVQHLIKVLHKKEGDTFTAGIVGGKSGTAVITSLKEELTFSFEPSGDGKKLSNLKMIIGFPRPIQLKRLLRDVAGLGVCQVHLTGTELGEKSYMQSTLVEKGSVYKMLYDGTVQAGSTHIPEYFLHNRLENCLNTIEEEKESAVKILLDNVKPQLSLLEYMQTLSDEKKSGKIIAAIGSERGWTDKERELFLKKGYTVCSMGERILRTETAATVAASIILAAQGVI